MKFTYDSYLELIGMLRKNGYETASYDDYSSKEKCVILRHDIDYSLYEAVRMADIEQKENVSSTYFVLLTSDFYNVFSMNGSRNIDAIQELGHEIGLHFDEYRYPFGVGNSKEICNRIIEEAELLSHVTGKPVTKVSMHRPSKNIIESGIQIPDIVNTYSSLFFKDFKYLSDSRRCWREPVENIIEEHNNYKKLHILIHPFWYKDEEMSLDETIKAFINSANVGRYESFNDNFTNLSEVIAMSDIK